jgi:hypothetical protein
MAQRAWCCLLLPKGRAMLVAPTTKAEVYVALVYCTCWYVLATVQYTRWYLQ